MPKLIGNNVICTCQDDLGHIGLGKVVENSFRVYWFPHMRETTIVITLTIAWNVYSPSNGKGEGYLHSVRKEDQPFDMIHVNHYEPLEKPDKGYRYIFSVDAFTKFIK